MSEDLRLKLGSLRSDMQLTLHTHHASRIWGGRASAPGRPAIIGLAGFVSVMNKMRIGAEQDDPYSDWWMIQIEERIDEAKRRFQTLREQIDAALAQVPPALSLGENLNVHPVRLPLFISAQLGFLGVYLLAEFDELARRVILAHHTALIDRKTKELWLDEGAHLLRALFTFAQRYRYTGTRRDDFAANNAAARAARDRYGELPKDVLEGTRRSRHAPAIVRQSGLAQLDGASRRDDETAHEPFDADALATASDGSTDVAELADEDARQ